MELDDLKAGWQNAGTSSKNDSELLKMTKITHHPSLKKIRNKLVLETLFLIFFLIVYYDWFDGDKKPLYANALLAGSLFLYIANDVIGYISVSKPIMGLSLKTSVENYLARIQKLSAFSMLFSFLYSVCFIIFFASVIQFTREKSFLLLGLIIILIQMMFWSNRTWSKWIKSLKQQLEQF